MTQLPVETDVQTVKRLLDEKADFLLLDCREASEYETAKIDGSVLLPMSEIQTRIHELENAKDQHIVVHCHHGGRSLQVTQWMRQQGFASTQNMTGGIDVWSQEIDADVPRY